MRAVSRRAIVGSAFSLVGGVACARPLAPEEPAANGEQLQEDTKSAGSAGTGGASPDGAQQTEGASHPENPGEMGAEPDDANSRTAPNGEAACETTVAVVGRNHGHILSVPDADVLAATERTYSMRGSSSHDHQLLITADEFRLLGQGQVLRKKSEFGSGHRHRILVRCQPVILPPEMISACDAVIAGEDGHEVIIPEAHVRGGIDREYDIQGVAGHTHTLKIRADDFARLLAGEKLDITTEYGAGHYHHAYLKYDG